MLDDLLAAGARLVRAGGARLLYRIRADGSARLYADGACIEASRLEEPTLERLARWRAFDAAGLRALGPRRATVAVLAALYNQGMLELRRGGQHGRERRRER